MASRISTSQVFQNGQTHVGLAREREVLTAEKAATNKELVRPSQDPAGWVNAANMKDDLSARDTIAKNASTVNRALTMSDSVLGQLQDYVQRAHELTVSASSDSIANRETRKTALTEVRGLFDQFIRGLNSRYAGRNLFGGFQSRGVAYNANGDYLGDNHAFSIEVSKGLVVPMGVNAQQVIGGEGLNGGVDIIDTLRGLIGALDNDNVEQIRASLPDLMKGIEQLSVGRTQIGARMGELERALNNHALERIDTIESIAKIEDADMVKTFSDLTRDQTVLRAAVSSTQKILSDESTQILFK